MSSACRPWRPSATRCAPRALPSSPRRKARAACAPRPRASCRRSSTSFNLRSMFDTEDVRDKLKMAGLARPGSARRLHVLPRGDADHRVPAGARSTCSSSRDYDYPALVKLGHGAAAAATSASICPTCSSRTSCSSRQTSIKQCVPRCARHAADLRAVGHVGRGRVPARFPRRSAAVAGARRGAERSPRRSCPTCRTGGRPSRTSASAPASPASRPWPRR